MSSQAPKIAFFGATGGVTNGVLVRALRSGQKVVALVRTPSKLTNQLQAQGLSNDTLSSLLTIREGNALDVAAVKATLTLSAADNVPNYLVPNIVHGLGATPSLTWEFCHPLQIVKVDNPTLCETAAKTLITALSEIYASNPALAQHKPVLTFVSTTGISRGPEDVPYGMQTLYHSTLAEPHKDKREMENVYRGNMDGQGQVDPVFAGAIGIRPTLLKGGVNADEGKGAHTLKAGTESDPAKGYVVERADVGEWMWVNVVGDLEKRKAWENEMVSLTS